MKALTTGIKISVIVVLLVHASIGLGQDQWQAFQNGGSLQNEKWELPTQWSPEGGIQWEARLQGYGQSSPVVAGKTIYVTSVEGGNKETLNLQAIDPKDGSQKWIFSHPNSSPEKNTVMVSRAAPTPVADAEGVIAFFEGGNLFALNHSGELRWKRDLKQEFGDIKARHGIAASLEQNKENIFVWCERLESPYVMAISKLDGKTQWKQAGLGSTSWSSPRLIQVGDESHLVLSAMSLIVGIDPNTGRRLWEFRNVTGNSSSTPVPISNGKFLMGSSGGREGIESVPSNGVISVKKSAEGYSVVWDWAAKKASCSFASPVAIEGRVYFVNRTGIIHCHDLDDGKNIFVERLPAGQIWCTPLAANNAVYFFGKDGSTSIIEPSNKLKVLAENELWSEVDKPIDPGTEQDPQNRRGGAVLYAAVVYDSKLLLRRGDILYCLNRLNDK